MHKHVIKIEEMFSNILRQFDQSLKVKTEVNETTTWWITLCVHAKKNAVALVWALSLIVVRNNKLSLHIFQGRILNRHEL